MIYLAGDSVFDNAAYTSPSLIQQMGSGARLLARDGAVIRTVGEQLNNGLRPQVTDSLVLSVGGNDALRSLDLVTGERHRAPDAMAVLAVRATEFEADYEHLLGVLVPLFRRVLCCTIYNGNFGQGSAPIRAGVRIFDDAIQAAARRAGADVLELRDVFTEPEDFANAIEPSHIGGAKLAAAIKGRLSGGASCARR